MRFIMFSSFYGKPFLDLLERHIVKRTIKLAISSPTDFKFKFSVFVTYSSLCQNYIIVIFRNMSASDILNLNNSFKLSVSGFGSTKNDFSWYKPAWGIYQNLFWLENDIFLMGKHLNNWNRISCCFENVWKLCQKMRLDALIIFLIEWTQMELILMGKQWKYWWGKLSKITKNGAICCFICYKID